MAVARPGVGGVAHVADCRDDEGCELALTPARPNRGRGCSAPSRTFRNRSVGSSSMPSRMRCDTRRARPRRWTRCPIAPWGRWPRFRRGDRWRPHRAPGANRGSRGQGCRRDGRSSAARPASGALPGRRRGSGSKGGRWRARSNGVPRSAGRAASWHQPWRPPSQPPHPTTSKWSAVTIRRVRRRADIRLHRSGRKGRPNLRSSATKLLPASRPASWTSRPPVRPTPKYWV